MSVFRDLAVTCPACGHVEHHAVADSINAAARPELRQQIVDDTFQRFPCARCGVTVVVDGPMLLVHFEQHHWLELFPAAWEPAWRAVEQETLRRFRQTVVEYAPPLVQVHADEFVVRTVFGLDALREKLVTLDAAIDDVALEALKLDLLRGDPEAMADPHARLRLRSATSDALNFAVQLGNRSAVELAVARSHLDTTASQAWQKTRDTVCGGPYVDVGRLLVRGDAAIPRQ